MSTRHLCRLRSGDARNGGGSSQELIYSTTGKRTSRVLRCCLCLFLVLLLPSGKVGQPKALGSTLRAPVVRARAQDESRLLLPCSGRVYLLEQSKDTVYYEPLKPTVNFDDVLGEVCFGALTGLAVGVGFSYLNVKRTEPHREHSDITAAMTGFIVGYPIGSAIGVYAIGSAGPHSGDFIATLLGSALGAVLFVLPAPIGAAIGFNATLRYDTPPSQNGFLNIEEGQIRADFPVIYLQEYPSEESLAGQKLTLALLRGTF